MSIQEQNTGSTGHLGWEYRTFERGYENFPYLMPSADYFRRCVHVGRWLIDRDGHGGRRVTRAVMRSLMTRSVLDEVLSSDLGPFIEVAVPTEYTRYENGGDLIWMTMAAINHSQRRPIIPPSQMTERVDLDRAAFQRSDKTPQGRVAALREEGYGFLHHIPEGREGELLRLWEKTFQWDEKGIQEFGSRLDAMRRTRPDQRGLWFSGVVDLRTDALVAVAQGERLDMPIGDGRSIPLVESTEWRRSDDVRRNGLTAAAVSHLNAQILNDIGARYPLIIAETNFNSEAHNVGFAALMDIHRDGGRRLVGQTLIQNVNVGDGLEPVDRLRDFTMVYLPEQARRIFYGMQQRNEILEGDL